MSPTQLPSDQRHALKSCHVCNGVRVYYLFSASEGLASVFRGAIDLGRLAKTLDLPADQFVTFAQTVGYPQS